MNKLTNRIKQTPPAIALLFIAPVLGELVSAHQSPLEFINPLNFLILSLPYGFGALICRELIVRWEKGFFNLLILGAAYGVYEEAVVVYSVFDPNWKELGALAQYGFWGGVNWTWSGMTIHFHIFISICASIILTELLYPARRNQRWLGSKGLAGCFAGILLWVPVMWLIMILFVKRPFPPAGLYVLAWLIVLFLGWAAYKLPGKPVHIIKQTVTRPVLFFLVGIVNISAFFFTVFITLELKFIPLLAAVLWLFILDAGTVWLLLYWSGNGYSWNERQRLALISGMLMFFIYFCFDKDFEHWTGTSLAGLAAIIGLWKLRNVIRGRAGLNKDMGNQQ